MRRLCALLILLVTGCGSSSSPEPDVSQNNNHAPATTNESSPEVEPAEPELSSTHPAPLSGAASQIEPAPEPEPSIQQSPAVLTFVLDPEVTLSDNPAAPLVGSIHFTTNRPAAAEVVVRDGITDRVLRSSSGTTEHRIPLWGMRAGKNHVVEVTLLSETGDQPELKRTVTFQAPPVPSQIPRFTLHLTDMQRMEPGVTLFNLIRWKSFLPDDNFGALVAVDQEGHVVWSWLTNKMLFFARTLPNGNLLCLQGDRAEGVLEVSPDGQIVRHLAASGRGRHVPPGAIAVPVDAVHHDAHRLPDGNLLILAPEVRHFEDYPHRSYQPRQREPAHVIGDVLVELSTEGEIVQDWKLLDLLDPQRIGYGSLHDFWDRRGYEEISGGTRDWSHSNGIAYDPRRDEFILSVRHQDAIIGIDRREGHLNWILGNREGWSAKHRNKLLKPVGGVKWPYHQHAVTVTSRGTLLCFDNGNYQATPPDSPLPASRNSSRVVEYDVDPEAMTVKQVWDYAGRGTDRFYSTFLSGVQELKQTGNVLITDGGILKDFRGQFTDTVPGVTQSAQLMEVTRGPKAEKVFHLEVPPQPLKLEGWSVYRAERISGLLQGDWSENENASEPEAR